MKASKLMVVLAMASVTVAFGKNGTAKAKLKSGKNAFSRRSNRQGSTSDFPLAFLVCGLVIFLTLQRLVPARCAVRCLLVPQREAI